LGRSTYKPKQVFILKKWLSENIEEPFLKKVEKRDIAEKTGLTPKQIGNWVKNIRKVSLYKLISKFFLIPSKNIFCFEYKA